MKNRILVAFLALIVSTLFSFSQAQDINLTGYTMTFDDEFNSLSATTSSPKGASNWYALPANGSTGYFSASNWNISAFSVSGGILSDNAYYANPQVGGQNWQSGILESVDTTIAGFTQQYGYFEVRCQMPNAGEGAWPAFWLDSTSGINHQANEEIDIFEWYGVCNTPGSFQAVIQEATHNWNTDGSQNQTAPYLYSPGTPMPGGAFPWQAYHIYGCQVDPVHITWYIDGVQTNQIATPTAYITSPFFIILNYALGGGWPLSGTPFTTNGTSTFLVDWVRVYSLPVAPVITSATTASATVGSPFSYQITATNSPVSYNATGLPGGLSVNTATGAITGTPTTAGTSTISLSATNASGTGTATLTLTTSSGGGGGNPSIAMQFQGQGTALLSTDSAGLSTVAQTNWNVLTGSSFTSHALVNNTGGSTTATLSGSANGTYFASSSSAPPAGNSKMSSGELYNGWPGAPTLTVANIPYANYDVYLYAGIDASGRAETVGLTPSNGAQQFYSFTTEGGGSTWTAATSTWNGSGTKPSLPTANYVHYSGLTASSFTLAWGAPGNGGLNGIQIVAVTSPPTITTQPSNQSVTVGSAATFSVTATGTPTLTYQWKKNGTNISGATGSSYTTPATVSGDNGSTFSVVVTNPYGNVTSSSATLTVNSPPGSAKIGIQFQGSGTALLATDSAGLSAVAQTNWNVLTGASFTNHTLSDNSGAATTVTISGSANGSYFASSSSASPAGNAKMSSGELFNGWPGAPTLTVANIPYAKYDVYLYAGIDATGRAETTGLTPSGGTAQYYSFTTEGGGSTWTAATSTWNGTGTQPSLPSANYVHFTGLTASSFTLAWGAPGNGGLNGIEIVQTQ